MAKSGRCASISVAIASNIERQSQPCATPQRPLCLSSLRDVGALPRTSLARLAAARCPLRPSKIAYSLTVADFGARRSRSRLERLV